LRTRADMNPHTSRSAVHARRLSLAGLLLALLASGCDNLPGRDVPSGGDGTQDEDNPVGGHDSGTEPPEHDAGQPPVESDDAGTDGPMMDAGPPEEFDAAPPAPENYVRVEAEDFLPGPDGYYDTTPENQGGYGRLNEGVDVGIANDPVNPGSLAVGYTRPGEWLRYELVLEQSAPYVLRARVAHETGGGQFSVFVDDQLLARFEVPSTGGWTNWTTLEKPLGMLAAGSHALKITVDSGGPNGADMGNLNFFDFAPAEGDAGLPDVDAAVIDAGEPVIDDTVRIEAESFLPGPDGYSDTTPENQGGWGSSTEGVDVGFAGDPETPGSLCIGYTRPGEWLLYELTLRRTAEYTLRARVAHESGGGTFSVLIDDVRVATFTIPSTGSWGTWTTIEQAAGPLSAGAHTLKLSIDTAGLNDTDTGNINYLELVPAAVSESDGGVATDAGTPELDAGSVDAGAPAHDAGSAEPHDAATPGIDAASQDAG
jgi:hypothetical protein